MKTRIFALAAMLVLLVSCAEEKDSLLIQNDSADSQRIQQDKPVVDEDDVFTATIEGDEEAEPGTKVYADSKMRTLWNADDRVSIFRKTTGNEEYRFTGEDGANAGNFSHVSGSKSQTALDYFYSLYPYSEATAVSADGVVSLTMPAEQVYKEKSFGIGANTMLSVTANNQLKFRNVGSFLSFKFYGNSVFVKSITLKGNNHEKLAGAAKVTMALNGTPAIQMQGDATESITLTCDTPVAISSDKESATEFWFVLPPTDFTKGITVTVADALGGTFEMNSAAHLTFERNKLTRLSAKQVVPTRVAVDLGLSVKWASCNVGASKPEEYGDYFAWGETLPKSYYDWSTYKWCNGSNYTLTKYNTSSNYGTVDNRTTLQLSDDAARVNWGESWRMPTDAEWTELRTSCDWTWTKQNGTNGYLVKSRTNNNSIFLPAAGHRYNDGLYSVRSCGYYWSSSLNTDYPLYLFEAGFVRFLSDDVSRSFYSRYNGFSVRPICERDKHVSEIHLNKTDLFQIEGASEQLTATVLPEDADNKGVKWSSSKSSIASVDENGLVTALEAGTAVITVTTVDGGKTAQCTVSVTAAAPAEAIDLGLSVKWATYNIGANSPEEYGDYFAWGETLPKSYFDWSTYKWCHGTYDSLTKYNTSSIYGTVDNRTTLQMSDDAARVIWGGNWRMPTDAEWTELRTSCDWTWTKQNGTNGYLVKSRANSNSIFLPAAGERYDVSLYHAGSFGHYWSFSIGTDGPNYAWGVYFYSANVDRTNGTRCNGFTVRPVTE